jgi:uncharacterized protein (TIGR02246 family)
MKIRIAMTVVSMTALLCSCSKTVVDHEAEGERLMQLSRDWSETVASGDAEATLAFWADDATVMAPGMPAFHGKEAIREFLDGMSKIPGFQISWEPISVHIADSGEMAYMIERNVATADDPSGNPVTTYGKVVTIWRRDAEGNWHNVVDMWNAAPPPD